MRTFALFPLLAMPACLTALAFSRQQHIAVPAGYTLHARVVGLDFPTAVTFSQNKIWVAEGGFLPGFVPKVKDVTLPQPGGVLVLSADDLPPGVLVGPLLDITFHEGWMWLAHRQVGANGWTLGAISRFQLSDPVGTFVTVLNNLPSQGDHSTDEIVFHGDRAFFSQGTATNTGIVGADNFFLTGWLGEAPTFHDFAPKAVALSGINYITTMPFPLAPDGNSITAAFHAFDSGDGGPGAIVPAATPQAPQEGIVAGNGAVYSFSVAGNAAATLRLEAWGLRNPFGLAFDPFMQDTLYVTNNGSDVRVDAQGVVNDSRPIANDSDDLFTMRVGGMDEFFGWPDFFHGPLNVDRPVTDPLFCNAPGVAIPCPQPIFDASFAATLVVRNSKAQLGVHVAATKLDFSTSANFGHVGDVFIGEAGSSPHGGSGQLTGHKVVRVDRDTEQVVDFIVNTGQTPAQVFEPSGFNRPLDVKFHNSAMLVVDLGAFEPDLGIVTAGSGKLWTLVNDGPAGGHGNPPQGGQSIGSRGTWPESVRPLEGPNFPTGPNAVDIQGTWPESVKPTEEPNFPSGANPSDTQGTWPESVKPIDEPNFPSGTQSFDAEGTWPESARPGEQRENVPTGAQSTEIQGPWPESVQPSEEPNFPSGVESVDVFGPWPESVKP